MIDSISTTKILLIGASGQVGTAITAILGCTNVVVATSAASRPGSIHLNLAEAADGKLDLPRLIDELGVRIVCCVGGMTNVERCETDPELAIQVNCSGPAAVAAAARAANIAFAYFSTDYVFDGQSGPYSEGDAPAPLSAYGRSKLLGELAVRRVHPDALIIRTTTVYGPDPGRRNFLYGLSRAVHSSQPLRVADDQLSTPTYNRDLARTTVRLLNNDVTGIVHVAGPERLSRVEFAHRAAIAMKLDPTGILGVPTRQLGQAAARPLQAGLRTERLRRLLPTPPMRTIEEAILDWQASEALDNLL